jgi:pimeloyl-ACP methyl ester carboxylesterase
MMNSNWPATRIPKMILLLASLSSSTGCFLLEARRNNETLAALSAVHGTVAGDWPKDRVAFAVMFVRGASGWEQYSNRILSRPGSFEFLATPGSGHLFVFVDLDGDLMWEPGEPSALVPSYDLVAGEKLELGALRLDPDGPAPLAPPSLASADVSDELVRVHHSDLATLDDERFGAQATKQGFWQPVDFAMKYGVGVSFLEPYDPSRTPVLFVHGAKGSPADFKAIIAGLDRSRYQAWVFSYPSGLRLELVATTLTRIVDGLQHELHFEQLSVVGHSMGGLVARSFVERVADRPDGYVRLLVTISSPFGGSTAAKSGVDSSPVVLPVWRDVSPGSPFLLALQKPLPACVRHHLLFGFKGGSTGDGPDDGTVSLSSMLAPRIQLSAEKVRGFFEDHESILASAEVVAEVNASLATAGEPPRVAGLSLNAVAAQ